MENKLTENLITSILKKVFPYETTVVGDEILTMIVEEDSDFEYFDGGSHLDFTQVIDILKLGADILLIILSIIEVKKKLSSKQESDKIIEVIFEFIRSDSDFEKIEKEKKEELIQESVNATSENENEQTK